MGESKSFFVWFGLLLAAFALAVFMAVTMTVDAHAQQRMCMPFPQFRESLANTYHETEVGVGVMLGGQSVVILFASPEGKTWTLLSLDTGGVACAIGAGEHWDAKDMPSTPGRDA